MVGLELLQGEAGRAGIYALVGGILLKLAEMALRRSAKKHHEALAEIDASLSSGAKIREELERHAEYLQKRLEKAERDLELSDKNLEQVRRLLIISESARQDAEAEVRLLKRAHRTPVPPSIPKEESE